MRKAGKAQIAGQIFIYAIAIVVVGLIIVYGYSAIKGFRDRGEEVEYITLKTNIENSVKSIASDYGSIKRPDFVVPQKYTAVCFVQRDSKEGASSEGLCNPVGDDYWPVACEGWKAGRNNVFLVPDGSAAFDVGDIKVAELDGATVNERNYVCAPVVNGRVLVQLKGLGDRVLVSIYEPEDFV
jgi:hypothetical protein